tara:strand:- start:242 stop:472 length:231 start_codon:yes stop_codon:yes gene_type:complete
MGINVFKNKSGRWFGIDSLFMALISVAVTPLIFGVQGIAAGMITVANGSLYLGMLGVISSAVLGFSGYYFAANLIA